MESEKKVCQNCKKDFTIESDDFAFYEKIKVPAPTWCPECRLKRRLIWRNGRLLFRRKDDASGNEIFSSFPSGVKSKVYDHEYWKSDSWNPLDYGREYDFSRSFFEQYQEFLYSVPWPSKSVQQMISSEYCDQAGFFKNSYLCFNGDRMEDSAYTTQCTDGKSCFDCSLSNGDELCYECTGVNGSYQTVYSLDCENCVDTWFSKNCISCTNCFGCVNLRHKSYCFFNEQLSKEDYEKRFKELNLESDEGIKKALITSEKFFLKYPNKYYHGFRAINSTGDYLRNVKNTKYSYFADNGEDSKFLYNVYLSTKDSYDYGPWGNASSQMYECLTCGDQCNKLKFCFESWPACRDLEYCCFCRSSSDCFACVSLKKKQYCIFNKQYSKEEYEILRDKIIQHMNEMPYVDKKGRVYTYGEFFPEEFSPFAYNESALQDIYPQIKEIAITNGYNWRDPDIREFTTTITTNQLPDIKIVDDKILKEVIKCESCNKAYRVINVELQYLKKMGIPLPRFCIACRAARRSALINPPHYARRKCMKSGCTNEFETSYAPDRPEIVYCEQCYNSEVA